MHGKTFPLGAGQETVLMSRAVAQASGVNLPPLLKLLGFHLDGRFEISEIESALTEVVTRHAALRVVIKDDEDLSAIVRADCLQKFARTGVLFQPVHKQSVVEQVFSVPLNQIDLRDVESDAHKDRISRLLEQTCNTGFGEGDVPRMRATLVTLSVDQHLLVILLDGLVCDGLSISIIAKELLCLLGETRRPLKMSSSMPFPAFAEWQERALQAGDFDKSILFWRQEWIQSAEARIDFSDIPFSLTGTAHENFKFAELQQVLDRKEADALRELARKAKTTLFNVFLAASAVVLAEYTGRPKVAIWSHLANRVQGGTLDAVGNFVNTHLLCLDVSTPFAVEELLNRTSGVIANAVRHQELPLAYLWRTLACIPRSGDAKILIDYRQKPRQMPGESPVGSRQITITPLKQLAARVSTLGIYVIEDNADLVLSCEFLQSRFNPEGVRSMLRNIRKTSLGFADDPRGTTTRLRDLTKPDQLNRDRSIMREFYLLQSNLIPELPEWVPRSHG